MRIGINALFLERPETGSGQYTRHLLEAMAKVDPTNEYLLFSPGPAPQISNIQYPISNIQPQLLCHELGEFCPPFWRLFWQPPFFVPAWLWLGRRLIEGQWHR